MPYVMKKILLSCLAALSIVAVSCTGNNKKKTFERKPFPYVQAPVMMSPEDQLGYLVDHFFDKFTSPERDYPCDTHYVSGVEMLEIEQAASNYAMLLSQVSLDKACKAVDALASRLEACEKADSTSNVFDTVSVLIEKYLYDPNSPLRDEDIYNAFARHMSQSELVPAARRESYAEDARLSGMNRRGTKAADFSFSERSGRIRTLYGIKADYTILFFSNPGCEACKEIIDALNGSEVVCEKIASKELAVLNIYIDEELAEWYNYMPIYSKSWYNGYDPNMIIRNDELYNVRAIPSLYFLDREKRVLFKDVPLERLMNNLPW